MLKSVVAGNRIIYGGLTIAVLLIGLASRRFSGEVSFIRIYVGDILWALMVFFAFAFIFIQWSTKAIVLAALGFSFGIEYSQLYHAPWIEQLRATQLGGLVLGFTFVWSDLICYSVGIGLGVIIEIYFIPTCYLMKGVKKENLPTKICATCQKPFTWRKKWARNWDEVKYCSDRCRDSRADSKPSIAN